VSKYRINHISYSPDLLFDWDSPKWQQAETIELTHFRPEGSGHRPKTSVRLLYDNNGIYGLFRVQDQFVLCRHLGYQSPVYKDSCVEFFVRPRSDRGYFNFEFNCGGGLLCCYITDPTRTEEGFREFTVLPDDDCRQIIISPSMPGIVFPEIEEQAEWSLGFFIPFSLLEKYAGQIGDLHGQTWLANFYKCADGSSHPHWASWTELPEKNFHLPEHFGEIVFE